MGQLKYCVRRIDNLESRVATKQLKRGSPKTRKYKSIFITIDLFSIVYSTPISALQSANPSFK